MSFSSLDEFLGINPDDELRRILAECKGFFGAIPDMGKLASDITEDVDGLWWGHSRCGVPGCDHTAWQLDERGYRCYEHR